MKITEWQTTIYRKDFATPEGKTFTKYSASISKKNGDKWEYGYIECNFKKGIDVADKTRIVVNNAWLSFYKTKENKTIPTIFISEFDLKTENLEEPQLPF